MPTYEELYNIGEILGEEAKVEVLSSTLFGRKGGVYVRVMFIFFGKIRNIALFFDEGTTEEEVLDTLLCTINNWLEGLVAND